MNEENDKILDAILKLVSCSQSLRYIIKDMYEMEEDANRCGGEYKGLSNIADMVAQEIETQVWILFEAIGVWQV